MPGTPPPPEPVTLAWPVRAALGEGPLWDAAAGALWFVDIEGRRLHRYEPGTGAMASLEMPGRASFIVPAAGGGFVLGMELGLYRWQPGTAPEHIADVGGPPGCRTNDATVDPQGRLWFGTMDLAQRAPLGQVHVFGRGGLRAAGGHCPITNGPACSPDGRVLYHVDTLGGIVWAFDIAARETLEAGRVFARIDPADGTPDGVTVDSEGCVWIALWGGACVRRHAPDGALLLQVALPCSQVTKVAFGGADLRTAYVTTARTGLGADALAAEPEAGSLFAFRAPAPGLPAQAAALP